jgi:hypothetical protein
MSYSREEGDRRRALRMAKILNKYITLSAGSQKTNPFARHLWMPGYGIGTKEERFSLS